MRGVMIQKMSNFKIQEEKNIESANFFCYCFILYKEKMLTDIVTEKSE